MDGNKLLYAILCAVPPERFGAENELDEEDAEFAAQLEMELLQQEDEEEAGHEGEAGDEGDDLQEDVEGGTVQKDGEEPEGTPLQQNAEEGVIQQEGEETEAGADIQPDAVQGIVQQDRQEAGDDAVLQEILARVAALNEDVKQQQGLLEELESKIEKFQVLKSRLQTVFDELNLWKGVEVQSLAEYGKFHQMWKWYVVQEGGGKVELKLIGLPSVDVGYIKEKIATLQGIKIEQGQIP